MDRPQLFRLGFWVVNITKQVVPLSRGARRHGRLPGDRSHKIAQRAAEVNVVIMQIPKVECEAKLFYCLGRRERAKHKH